MLENVSTLVYDKCLAKGLSLSFDVAPDVPPRLLGDPLRLGQILINYTNNAVKFTERGGITVSVRRHAGEGESLVLFFSVLDTGIGLTPAQSARLFQSFEQADGSTTRRFGGTGLGLAITRSLVELMGGRISVQSKPGVGSLFQFDIPMTQAVYGVAGRKVFFEHQPLVLFRQQEALEQMPP